MSGGGLLGRGGGGGGGGHNCAKMSGDRTVGFTGPLINWQETVENVF